MKRLSNHIASLRHFTSYSKLVCKIYVFNTELIPMMDVLKFAYVFQNVLIDSLYAYYKVNNSISLSCARRRSAQLQPSAAYKKRCVYLTLPGEPSTMSITRPLMLAKKSSTRLDFEL